MISIQSKIFTKTFNSTFYYFQYNYKIGNELAVEDNHNDELLLVSLFCIVC